MTKTVVLPDAKEVEFPDDATIPEMNRALAWNYGDQYFPKTQSTYVPKELKPKGEFFPSLVRGWDMMEGVIGSGLDAIGEATGWEGLEKYGERVAEANQKEIEEWDRTHPRLSLGDVKGIWGNDQGAIDYIQQALGELIPSMGIAATGALAGTAAAPFVGVGALTGAGLGAFLPSALMGTGEVQETIKELDPDKEAPLSSLGGGALIGALDVLGLALPITKVIGKVGVGKAAQILSKTDIDKKVAKSAIATASNAISRAATKHPRLKSALLTGVISSPVEGLTERLQELTAIEVAEGVTGETVMNRAERLLEATLMGMIGGGAFGTTAGAIAKVDSDGDITIDTTANPLEGKSDVDIALEMIAFEALQEQQATDADGNEQVSMPEETPLQAYLDAEEEQVKTDSPKFRSWLRPRLGNVLKTVVLNSTPFSIFGEEPVYKITDEDIKKSFGLGKASQIQINIIKEELRKKGFINEQGIVIKKPPALNKILKNPNYGIGEFKRKRKVIEPKKKWSPSIPNRAGLHNYRGFQIIKNDEGPIVWQIGADTITEYGQDPEYNDAANSLKEAKNLVDEYYNTGAIFDEEVGVLFSDTDAKRIAKLQEQRKTRGQQHSGEILGKAVEIEQQQDGTWNIEVNEEVISTGTITDIETAKQVAKKHILNSDPSVLWRLEKENFPLGKLGAMAFSAFLAGKNFFRRDNSPYSENAFEEFQQDIKDSEKDIAKLQAIIDDDLMFMDSAEAKATHKGQQEIIERRKKIKESKKEIANIQKEIQDRKNILNTPEALNILGRNDIAIPMDEEQFNEMFPPERVDILADDKQRQAEFDKAFPGVFGLQTPKKKIKGWADLSQDERDIYRAKEQANELRSQGKGKEAKALEKNIKEKEADLKHNKKVIKNVTFFGRQFGSNNGSSRISAEQAVKNLEEGSLKGVSNTASIYQYLFNGIRQIGSIHPVFAIFARRLQNYSHNFRHFLSNSIVMSSGMRVLNKEQRYTVNKFTEAANLLGQTGEISADGTRWVLMFDENFEAIGLDGEELRGQAAIDWKTFGDNEKMYEFKVGEEISLELGSPEAIAYEGRRTALDYLYTGLITSLAVNMGYKDIVDIYNEDTSIPLSERIKTIADEMSNDDVSLYTDSKGKPLSKKKMTRNAAIIKGLEENKRDGYFPNIREGDGVIRVDRIVEQKDKNGKGTGKFINVPEFRTDITVPFFRGKNFEKFARDYVNKNFPNLQEQYGAIDIFDETKLKDGEYADNTFVMSYHSKADMDTGENLPPNLTMVEGLLLNAYKRSSGDNTGTQNENTEAFEKALEDAFKQIQQDRLSRGIRAHSLRRKGVPGYITPQNIGYYHDKAFQLYTSQASRYIARMFNERDINDAITELQKITGGAPGTFGRFTPNLSQVAKDARDFTMSPQGASSLFKSIAFFGFLGGNISSLLVNLTQNFVTGAYLHGIYGIKVRGTTLKAVADATRMIKDLNMASGEFMILPLEIKGKTNNQLNAAERDLVNRGQALYKKFSRFLTREEYQMLYDLQQDGVLGRINTEAIAENADVTGDFMRQKLRIPVKAAQGIGMVGGALTTLYSSGEMLNRVAASLAGYRAAKKFGVDGFNNFHAGVPGQQRLAGTLLDNEEGYRGAAQMLSDATQFNLDPANRPMMARLLGGVPIQFMPFVTMMIEVYSNAFFGRYGMTDRENVKTIAGIKVPLMTNRQANRALIALVAQQMALGGLFAIPFMDDLDEAIKLLSNKTGMTKRSVYQIFYETLIDDMGLSADAATALLRGPMEGYGPISMGRRIALSPFQNFLRASDNPALMIGGPAASFLDGWIERVGKAIGEGEWDKAIAYSLPIAATTNIAKAYYSATEGVYTGTGRQINDGLQGEEILFQMLGFTTQELSRDRAEIRLAKYLDSKTSAVRDRLTDKLTKLQMRLVQSTDRAQQEKFRQQSIEILNYIREHDQGKEMEDKIDPTGSIWTSVLSRMRQELSPRAYDIAAPKKAVRPRIEELIK